MTILEPGTFKVSDHRKAIPDWVKVQAVINAIAAGRLHAVNDEGMLLNARDLQYDHRPSLNTRPFDTEARDFIPPQNDPAHIDPIFDDEHQRRTTGRKPGAERTGSTRGSDVGEAAHGRHVQERQAVHLAKMASKAGNFSEAARILSSVKRKKRPKRKIPNRPFPKGHRPLSRHQEA